MRDHSWHKELKREEAIATLIEAGDFRLRSEKVPIHEALSRVTALDCPSLINQPNALCGALDGIAVHFADFEQGMPDTSDWQLGREYDWGNTGVALPEGYDSLIPIEQCSFDEDGVLTLTGSGPACKGDKTRAIGSDFALGQILVPARTKLTPTKLAALATCGYTEVEVVVKPKVIFVPTGDELVEIGTPLPQGKSYETNGILLASKLTLWGADPEVYPCLPDDWDQIKAAILKAADEADIVVINAGSSKGSKDFNMEVLEEIGTVFCHETNHGPGRHTSASVVNGTVVLGLSGPPGGCEITSDWYLKPLVDQYLYGREVGFERITGTLAAPLGKAHGQGKGGHAASKGGHAAGKGTPAKFDKFGKNGPKPNFFAIKPVKVERVDGEVRVLPAAPGGKHAGLLEIDAANGYVCMHPKKLGELSVGDQVEVELRFPYLAR